MEKKTIFNKAMVLMLLSVGILFGGIFGYKAFGAYMMGKAMASMRAPAVYVSTMKVGYSPWQPTIKASGSLTAVNGVEVTTEISGLVHEILFNPGTEVKENEVLLKLNADTELAQLKSMEAAAELAMINYNRNKEQFAIKAISQATLDASVADLKGKEADVRAQASIVAKKTIIAPFAGRLGISEINTGQYLNPGEKIVTLQSLDPIYIDFSIPQQLLVKITTNQTAIITTDSYPGKYFVGKISSIDPKVDPTTRNVQVEAIVSNPKHELLPGMFAEVTINTEQEKTYLTVPQSAISFNSFGDIIYIVEESQNDNDRKPILKVKQSFVKVGDTRGDQIAILEGLKEGDTIVTSGQLKLRNGSEIIVNNSVQPNNNFTSLPVDE